MANELELKYGCNPNQKPARIFMKRRRTPHRSIEWTSRLYQSIGCIQQLATSERTERSYQDCRLPLPLNMSAQQALLLR